MKTQNKSSALTNGFPVVRLSAYSILYPYLNHATLISLCSMCKLLKNRWANWKKKGIKNLEFNQPPAMVFSNTVLDSYMGNGTN